METGAEMKTDNAVERERKALARWLAEWRLDRELSKDSDAPDYCGGTTGMFPGPSGARFPRPARGDIRLLHPATGSAALSRPVYVAVIETASDTDFIVAPFGLFSTPALPGEWRTGFRALPVRVLCLWNWRTVSSAALRLSWRARRMPPCKLGKAAGLLLAVRSGLDPESVAPGETGPPVRHPLDPRLRYEAEEASAFDEQIRAMEEAARNEAATTSRVVGEGHGVERLLAAEPPAAHEFRRKPAGDAAPGKGRRD
jgi:hypothetical protein